MSIYLKTNGKKFKNKQELLEYGFRNGQFVVTYLDPECKKQECHKANRSFGDLLLICKTYFPKTTERGLARTIFKMHDTIGLAATYCNTIDKVVFDAHSSYKEESIDEGIYGDEYDERGEGTHSWNEIEQLAKSKIKKKKC